MPKARKKKNLKSLGGNDKAYNTCLLFHPAAIFSLTFFPDSRNFIPFLQRLYFWTKGAQRVAKALTEVWKPGANNKVVAVLCFLTQNLNVNCLRFTDFFLYFRYPQQLENWPESV